MLRSVRSASFLALLLAAVWTTTGGTGAVAQDAEASIKINAPMSELESGSLLDLFAAFREKEGAIRFVLESKADVVPVRFQTVVMRDGERIGRSVRAPMPYFPGEMIVCPETWDFISALHQVASDDGQLPAGEYDVRLSVMSAEEKPLGEPGRFQFSVPEK